MNAGLRTFSELDRDDEGGGRFIAEGRRFSSANEVRVGLHRIES